MPSHHSPTAAPPQPHKRTALGRRDGVGASASLSQRSAGRGPARRAGKVARNAVVAVAEREDGSVGAGGGVRGQRSGLFDVNDYLDGGREKQGGEQTRRDELGEESGSSSESESDSESESESDADESDEFEAFDELDESAAATVHLEEHSKGHASRQSTGPRTVIEKDEEEEELEALVFGDSAGFRDAIHQLSLKRERARRPAWSRAGAAGDARTSDGEAKSDESDLEAMRDDDLFFVDAQGADGQAPKILDARTPQDDINLHDRDASGSDVEAAWGDSDDARIRVSLAGVPRLRKLRVTEDEDVVSGKEYIRRLRQQYLKLNPKPQWVEDATQLQQRRKRRKTSHGEDATDSSDSDVDIADADSFSGHRPLADLLRDATSLTRSGQSTGKRKFRPEVINIQRTRHIADKGPSAITTLQIHPQLPLLIASGPSSKMDLYHLHDNAPNYHTHITSLWMRQHPFTTTLFHPLSSDPRIILSARRRYFHVWNLASGQIETITRMYGHAEEQRSMESFKIDPTGTHIAFIGSARKGGGVINLVDANTLQWVAQARIEGRGGIADFAWWRNGAGIVVAGKNGEITEWDLGLRRVVARWRDEGAVGTTTLALGGKSKHTRRIGGDAYIAIGSSAGIVNVYSRAQWFADAPAAASAPATIQTADDSDSAETDNDLPIPTNPAPLRALDQLTTPISHLAFAPSGQVLCMASRWKKDALRLVHLPSCTVYRNWPTANTPLGRISAVCWGEAAGAAAQAGGLKLVVGNEAGRVAAWDVRGE